LTKHWSDGDIAVTTVVNQYIKGNSTPVCPANGIYSYGRISANPTCTFIGTTTHRLSLAGN
jgi:hypothetical protein